MSSSTKKRLQSFTRLAVFRGGATFAGDRGCHRCRVGLVESLVDKSLLRRRRESPRHARDDSRVRAGRARVHPTRRSTSVDAHAAYFLEVAEGANLNAGKAARRVDSTLDIAIAEQDNIDVRWTGRIESRIATRLLGACSSRRRSSSGSLMILARAPGCTRRCSTPARPEVDPTVRAEALRSYASCARHRGRSKDLALRAL